jgi:hypothetical protein
MATIEPLDNAQQPISDDQELAKVLAGVDLQTDAAAAPALPPTDSLPEPEAVVPPVVEPPVAPVLTPVDDSGDLAEVKQEALTELRPLVDKLNIPAEEKFDTYLLLLRSTDDKTLIEPAHETAKLIEDESRRAQALLDIIKEIDFLSQAQK